MTTSRMISVIRSMSSDDWYWLLQVGSAVTALIAFGILAATALVGRSINRRDSARLISLETDLTKTKLALSLQEQATADSKRALLELQERMDDRKFTDE